MSLPILRPLGLMLLVGVLGAFSGHRACAQQRLTLPSATEVERLVVREPLTLQSWPAWRPRLLAWMSDRSHRTDAAYNAARQFLLLQAGPGPELPPSLAQDALAWYLLGSAYLYQVPPQPAAPRAEKALRRSLALNPDFARAHRNLALALLLQEPAANPAGQRSAGLPSRGQAAARKELDEARRLDPTLPLGWLEGQLALHDGRFAEAERLFAKARRDDPHEVGLARAQAEAILQNPATQSPLAGAIKPILEEFPNDGILVVLHAVALAQDRQFRAAVAELERARELGTDPSRIVPPEVLRRINQEGAVGPVERKVMGLARILAGFATFYAVFMALMAGVGLLLARATRGVRALHLLEAASDHLIQRGKVARTRQESWLGRVYGLTLVGSLVLFYAAVPFVLIGLLAGTGLLLYLVFLMPRIPVRLIVIIVVVGLGGAWAVLRSLFARPASGGFGLPKTAADSPRLYQALADVAARVDTEPIDEVYVGPGAAIGVHQEGRGPFGIFGTKRRVLTLGLSTMHFLTADELRSILAHEYAHFSHRDTFYSRFIYQVTLSIAEALQGMGRAGGWLNYFNPFFWFLYLYYRCFNLMSAGFSRSREFLADRMAAGLYGADVFQSALSKATTDGTLFEVTMYDNIIHLLAQDKAFQNMYTAFRSFREEPLQREQREALYQKMLGEKASLFASHPTFGERIEAVAGLPPARQADTTPALQLFEDPETLEKELTVFLTDYFAYMQRLQAQAAAAAT